MWMCQVGNKPGGGQGCGFFEWGRFTDDGVPIGWKTDEEDMKQVGKQMQDKQLGEAG